MSKTIKTTETTSSMCPCLLFSVVAIFLGIALLVANVLQVPPRGAPYLLMGSIFFIIGIIVLLIMIFSIHSMRKK